eukprot:4747555-Pleurochrysis_carterae.AAC.1
MTRRALPLSLNEKRSCFDVHRMRTLVATDEVQPLLGGHSPSVDDGTDGLSPWRGSLFLADAHACPHCLGTRA